MTQPMEERSGGHSSRKPNSDLSGVIGVCNTPFTEDNRIDCDSLRRYVDYGIASHVSGFLVPAMAAEVGKLGDGERELMVDTVVQQVGGRVPVIGGASAPEQSARLHYVDRLQSLGCDGILVSIPFTDEKAFERDIGAIAEVITGFLMIQDWDFHGSGIPVDTIVRLFAQIEVFRYLKVEVVPAGVKYTQVIDATHSELHVSGGWASSQMIEGLDRGVDGFMSTILPSIYHRIYQLHRAGEREQAKELFRRALPILAFSHQHLDISIHFNKRLVHRQGLFSTAIVRQPTLPFDAHHQRIADELIDEALQLVADMSG